MAKRMSRRLVALSASAIAAVYLAGLTVTQAADAQLAGLASAEPTPVVATATIVAAPSATPRVVAASPTSTPSTATAYRDGTYQGEGTSRFGNVAVAVTIQGGRITAVSFTRVTTSYPVSRIAALPAQVVARQSAAVDNVTGATYSARAFRTAIQQALAAASTAA
jgi:uncharacterized protein with FMN-binding domain